MRDRDQTLDELGKEGYHGGFGGDGASQRFLGEVGEILGAEVADAASLSELSRQEIKGLGD